MDKINLTEESYIALLNKILINKEEERVLALDRYRKADENMTSNDNFMLLGKNAVSFLRLASDTTNDLANLAKEVKSIVFKDLENGGPGAGSSSSDDEMKMIIDLIEKKEKESLDNPNDNPNNSTDIEPKE